jgi:chaperonin GroES
MAAGSVERIKKTRRNSMTTNTKTRLRPLADRVLIKRNKSEEQQFGGLILPDSSQNKQDMGIVISVGPGKKDKEGRVIDVTVKVGDHVMWDKYGGHEITLENEDFVMVKAEDIIAIVD